MFHGRYDVAIGQMDGQDRCVNLCSTAFTSYEGKIDQESGGGLEYRSKGCVSNSISRSKGRLKVLEEDLLLVGDQESV